MNDDDKEEDDKNNDELWTHDLENERHPQTLYGKYFLQKYQVLYLLGITCSRRLDNNDNFFKCHSFLESQGQSNFINDDDNMDGPKDDDSNNNIFILKGSSVLPFLNHWLNTILKTFEKIVYCCSYSHSNWACHSKNVMLDSFDKN